MRRASLQGKVILSPEDFFKWASENIKKIKFLFVSTEKVVSATDFLTNTDFL